MDAKKRATDQIILPGDVRRVMTTLRCGAWEQRLKRLEHDEPALAVYINSSVESIEMTLYRVGYNNDQLRENKQFLIHALLVVHELTRSAHRRLLDEFLPAEHVSDGKTPTDFDPCVSNEDGITWMQELINGNPTDLADDLANSEPAVVGVSIRVSQRTREKLISMGASAEVADVAANKVLLAGIVAAELMRRGYAKRSNTKGDTHA